MDGHGFDELVRSLTGSRRLLLSGALVVAAGWFGGGNAAARKRRANKKRKKAKPNAFGCLNVGQRCRGASTLCCSGVCGGKKPKQGKQDKRRCIAHSAGACTPQRSFCIVDDARDSLCNLPDLNSVCWTTTGNAGFCGTAVGFNPVISCQRCQKDKDCEALGFQRGSACVVTQVGESCGEVCAATDNLACIPPAL